MSKQLKTNLTAIMAIAVIIATIFTIGYTVGKNKATNEIWENNRHTETIVVKSGDTLWGIAKEHCPDNVYIHEYIEEIKTLNNIDGNIYAGDKILVYIY